MDAQTIAIHEAGHAVMQWLVGWESDLEFIQMRPTGPDVVDKGGMKVKPPDRLKYRDDGVARKKLLVLLAGAATTNNLDAQHNKEDFTEACHVLADRFGEKIGWRPGTGVEVIQAEANDLLQEANSACNQIVAYPLIREAIEAIAALLLKAETDATGFQKVTGDAIVQICQQTCGDIRSEDLWPGWI